MANPLDRFISQRRSKFEVKLPVFPPTGIKKVDEPFELWRRNAEKQLERIMAQVTTNVTTQVTTVTQVLPTTTEPVPAVPGQDGDPGAPGTIWIPSNGVPTEGMGTNGDWALNTLTGDIYQKVDYIWTLIYSIGPQKYTGIVELAVGPEYGTVTGLGLSFVPTKCITSIMRYAGGPNLTSHAVTGTLTADGFDYELSSIIEATGIFLVYELLA